LPKERRLMKGEGEKTQDPGIKAQALKKRKKKRLGRQKYIAVCTTTPEKNWGEKKLQFRRRGQSGWARKGNKIYQYVPASPWV